MNSSVLRRPETILATKDDNTGEELIDFPSLFKRQVKKTPLRTCLVFEDRTYTYQQLDELSDEFKHSVLLNKSTASTQLGALEMCVGICVDKSPEAIAAMLGVLKAGAAFVPLDPDFPVERIAFMVEDASIKTIIAQDNHQDKIAAVLEAQLAEKDDSDKIHWISAESPYLNTNVSSKAIPYLTIEPASLAYVMYTSGSTGKPKGVQIEHAALAAYCYADIERYEVTAEDRTLQFSTINFDIAIEEIFPPLLVGGSVVIRPSVRSDSLNELSAIINKYEVTAVHIATAYWHEWVDLMIASEDEVPASLRLMVVTGEKVSTKHYQHWKALCDASRLEVLWCNAYGPTEATVSASVFIPDEDFQGDNMPIGIPLKRYTARIVDEDFIELPVGETGQLLIGGPALTRGYLNRPELNAEAFIDVVGSIGGTTEYQLERMYKTGDLARWLPSGDIEFAGRIDHQIKIGSYRIEPGEIEAAINHHPSVLESLVSYDEVNGSKSLVSYIATGPVDDDDGKLDVKALAEFLNNRLPPYMVPARYVFVENFPKTANGKIDRKALPSASLGESVADTDKVLPRNDLEDKLASIWQQVLNIPEVGIHHDFFALGGSSLLAVGIVSRIMGDLKLELPVRDFFANPTIATQARHIQSLLHDDDTESLEDIASKDSIALRNRLPILQPCFIDSGKERLFGMHYKPQPSQPSRSHAVLICHPLGHEYSRSYRNLQQLTLHLAQSGFDCLRFDYEGTGNSSGHPQDSLVSDYIENVHSAAEFIQTQCNAEKLSIIGLRMGASLAVSADIRELENLILWDPIVKGEHYIDLLQTFHDKALSKLERYRVKRLSEQSDQLYGYAMSPEQRASLKKYELPYVRAINKLFKCPYHQVMITSAGFQRHEPGRSDLLSNCQHYATTDQIQWHHRVYADSAFSSPEAFDVITKVLKGGKT